MTPATSLDFVSRVVRWLARGLSLLAAGMIVAFFIGDGGVNPLQLSAREGILMALVGMAWLGLLVAWRWELAGAAMTLGGMLLFYAVEFFAAGHFPRGWTFGFIALPGALFLYCALRNGLRGRRLGQRRLAG